MNVISDFIDNEFKETSDLKYKSIRIGFSKIHTFPYSKRNGTVAATMPNHLDGTTKKCRVREVLSLSDKYELEYYVGNEHKYIFLAIQINGFLLFISVLNSSFAFSIQSCVMKSTSLVGSLIFPSSIIAS